MKHTKPKKPRVVNADEVNLILNHAGRVLDQLKANGSPPRIGLESRQIEALEKRNYIQEGRLLGAEVYATDAGEAP